eukprot:2518233-Rhodomonas_salina.1
MESGLSAFKVSESETRWCACGDGEAGPFLDLLQIQLILICFLLTLYVLYCRSQEYFDDNDFRLAIHYTQSM